MPTTMHAVAALQGLPVTNADALVDVEIGVPELRPNDLLVRVEAISVNPVDAKVRAGLPSQSEPRVLGWDAAGTVEALGTTAQGFAVGDRVWYAGDIQRAGSNADLHAVDARIVARAPESLGFAEAAALPLTTLTAWEALFERLGLTAMSDGTLVVLGGAGGVGSVMIQLAKLRTAERVLASAGKPESATWVTALGADGVVDQHDLVASVLAAAPDGVEHLFSPHSAGNVEAFAQVVKPFGGIVAIDDPVSLDLMPLKPKSISWHWELMFTRSLFQTPDMAVQGRILAEAAALVDAGQLRSTATTTIQDFTAVGLREAHRLVETSRTVGKVVVSR